MSEFNADHGVICAEFLRLSRQYLADGNLLQASEKGWGAVAHAAKLFAESRDGLEYERHEQLREVVTEMGIATNRHQQIRRWSDVASRLHQNFYDDSMDALTIGRHLNDVERFVNLARGLTGLPPIDP